MSGVEHAKRASRWAKPAVALAVVVVVGSGCHRQDDLVADNELLYRQSQLELAKSRYLAATRLLGDIGLITPISSELDSEIKMALADVHFYQSGSVNVVEAQHRYEQFLSFYPLDPRAPYADYQVGVCLLRQAEDPENDQEYSERAARHFERMVRELPRENPWRRAAQVKLVEARNTLAEHEWHIAEYYLDKGYWRGAIVRLQKIVNGFPGVRRREEALFELSRAQMMVGDYETACGTLNRMLTTYDRSETAEQAREMREEISTTDFGGRCRTEDRASMESE